MAKKDDIVRAGKLMKGMTVEKLLRYTVELEIKLQKAEEKLEREKEKHGGRKRYEAPINAKRTLYPVGGATKGM